MATCDMSFTHTGHFNVEVESANLGTFFKEFIEITFDLEGKSMYTWMNEKTGEIS